MKNNTKKIKQYSMLALAASAVIPMACKEDKTEPDDPEIDVALVNLTLTYTTDLQNRDTTLVILGNELDLDLRNQSSYKYVYMDFDGDSNFQNDNDVSVNSETWDMLRILPSGSTIDTSTAAWLDPYNNDDGYLYVFDKDPAPGAKSGIAGQGDKFVAFRNGTGSSFKYGWMKVNVSSDGNTLTLKEVAMSNVANKVIKVGAK